MPCIIVLNNLLNINTCQSILTHKMRDFLLTITGIINDSAQLPTHILKKFLCVHDSFTIMKTPEFLKEKNKSWHINIIHTQTYISGMCMCPPFCQFQCHRPQFSHTCTGEHRCAHVTATSWNLQ